MMYAYRNMSPEERKEIVRQRTARGFPLHAPPHPAQEQTYYLLTAACFEHIAHMREPDRRRQIVDLFFESFILAGIDVDGWAVLPNHYHFLVHLEDFASLSPIFRRVHGRTSYEWNQQDNQPERKVWYRYSDRAIRSESHYYASLNYIHYNLVKHGYCSSPYDWKDSSLSWYLDHHGKEWLQQTWKNHPILDFGKGWDDPGS